MIKKMIWVLLLWPTSLLQAEALTLPMESRPEWLRREGIVMAGSWEQLIFRARRVNKSYTPTAEQLEGYRREQSPEMIAQLKDLGVNFVMIPGYKGFGLQTEAEGMADSARFARLCHEAGLHVGVYLGSGTVGWETLFKEIPEARDWLLLDEAGKPIIYGIQEFRYFWNRNHPVAAAHHKEAIDFAIQEIKTDVIHFDNLFMGPHYDSLSVERFRGYLAKTFSPAELAQMGIEDVTAVVPPKPDATDGMLRRAWQDFGCQSLAEAHDDMGRYIRARRPDMLVVCNPYQIRPRIEPPVDHGRLVPGGEAIWHEENDRSGYRDGQWVSGIRTLKIARAMNNMAFVYNVTPLEIAESIAFNLDSLGCVCWFEYGRIQAMPGKPYPFLDESKTYIRFFNARRDLLRDAAVVADVAVLRNFPSQVFADPKHAELTYRVEQAMIENRVPFQIIFDHQLADLGRYRALVLAGCVAFSDEQIDRIKRFVSDGGRLCVIGPAGEYDQWLRPRSTDPFADLSPDHVVRVGAQDDVLAAVRRSCANRLSLDVESPVGLGVELTEQTHRRLVHLVNYREEHIHDVGIELRVPAGKRVKSVTLAAPQTSGQTSLDFTQDADQVTFRVPVVEIYVVAVASWE